MIEKYFLGQATFDEVVDWIYQVIYNAICKEVAESFNIRE